MSLVPAQDGQELPGDGVPPTGCRGLGSPGAGRSGAPRVAGHRPRRSHRWGRAPAWTVRACGLRTSRTLVLKEAGLAGTPKGEVTQQHCVDKWEVTWGLHRPWRPWGGREGFLEELAFQGEAPSRGRSREAGRGTAYQAVARVVSAASQKQLGPWGQPGRAPLPLPVCGRREGGLQAGRRGSASVPEAGTGACVPAARPGP